MFVLLIVTSLQVFPHTIRANQTSQDKAMDFMENVLPINTSKYTITLRIDTAAKGRSLFNYNISDLQYELSRGSSRVYVDFRIENDIISCCNIYPTEGPVITNKQYSNLHDAVADFLKTYQTYSKIDSNKLLSMLDDVNITEDPAITIENTKLTITTTLHPSMERNVITFKWVQVINGVEYPSLELTFDKDKCLFLQVADDRVLYTISDTAINISKEQAIDIALENLAQYSYEMSDGSIVSDLKASKDNAVAKLTVSRSNYEFRPLWDVRILLDEEYPGSVFCIATFICTSNGEILSHGPSGPFNGSDYMSYETPSTTPDNTSIVIVIVAISAITIVASAIGLAIKKKRVTLGGVL
jgi:hypothetical protein